MAGGPDLVGGEGQLSHTACLKRTDRHATAPLPLGSKVGAQTSDFTSPTPRAAARPAARSSPRSLFCRPGGAWMAAGLVGRAAIEPRAHAPGCALAAVPASGASTGKRNAPSPPSPAAGNGGTERPTPRARARGSLQLTDTDLRRGGEGAAARGRVSTRQQVPASLFVTPSSNACNCIGASATPTTRWCTQPHDHGRPLVRHPPSR